MFFFEIILIGSLSVIAYTYAFYPLLISILAKVFPHPVSKADYTPTITLLIVAYNSEELIAKKLDNCLSLNYPQNKLQILVVSDGSDDLTDSIVQQYSDRNVNLLSVAERRGKAACLNDAFSIIENEYVVLNDVRQTLNNDALLQLMKNFADKGIGAVSGSLLFSKEGENTYSDGIGAYWRYEKFIRNAEGKFDSVVGVTGAIYALRKNLFKPIPAGVILDDVLIPMNAVLKGSRIIFDPSAKAFDIPSNDPIKERKRKIRTTAGNWQLLSLVADLNNPIKNRIWLQFISHKILRIFSPFFLLSAFLSNGFLAFDSTLFFMLFLTQTLFYLTAILGMQFKSFGNISIVKIVLAFCSLNWYAFLGGIEFYKNKNAHLW